MLTRFTQRIVTHSVRTTSVVCNRGFSTSMNTFADNEPSSVDGVSLTFSSPHQVYFHKQPVHMVCLPGEDGDFTVLQEHAPIIAELRAGMVSVYKADESEAEKEDYFVSGGWCFTHEDSSTDVSVPEAFKLEDFDADALRKEYNEASAAHAAAADGSVEKANAEIDLNTYQSLAASLGITL